MFLNPSTYLPVGMITSCSLSDVHNHLCTVTTFRRIAWLLSWCTSMAQSGGPSSLLTSKGASGNSAENGEPAYFSYAANPIRTELAV